MTKGLEALKSLIADYYEMCQDLGNNDDQYQRCNQTSERAIIEKELRALEIILKKNLSPQDFILCCYTMNNNEWISYGEYKEAYMRYYEDDEYLLLEEEYYLLIGVLR